MKKFIHLLVLFVLLLIPFQSGAAAALSAPLNIGTYDDKDAAWTYSGTWVNYSSAPAYQHSVHLSRAVNDETTLDFNGDHFDLIYSRGLIYGSIDVYVDGNFETNINQNNGLAQYQQRWSSPSYTDGLHSVRIVHSSGRYVNVDGIQVYGPPDLVYPATIVDLGAATGLAPGTVDLSWTAPGDDGVTGTASSYLVRYSFSAIQDESDWNAAFPVAVVPAPSPAGTAVQMTVSGLAPGATYYFSVRAADEQPNLGALSNSPSASAAESTPLTIGKVDERNANIFFSGNWVNQAPLAAYTRTLRYSTSIGDSAAFMFQGTDFELSFQTSNQQGNLAVYVDGAFTANVNEYSPLSRFQRKWNSPIFTNGLHSVQLIHASGARVNLDAVLVRLTFNWPTVSLQQVVGGLNSPVDLVNAGDGSGRMFIVQQDGLIHILQGGTVAGTFLDISSKIAYGGEQGLLSAAFPPNYSTSHHFYVYYTNTAGNLVLSRIGLTDASTADPTSEQIILTIPHPGASNHNGGHLAFGPDGYLYLSTGDGGGGGDPSGNGQNINALLGKMLRLDVETGNPATYTVPASNPFVGVAGADEIWAYGLRNPWRYSFDSLTGDLYIGDVGQDVWEEVDFQAAGFAGGANYGWNVWEGNHCYSPPSGCTPPAGYVAPVAEYNHGSNDSYGCAITGGYVYRGAAYPALQGIYFYSDYCTGRLLALRNVGGTWITTQLADTPYNVSGFGVDEAGNLYVIDLGGAIYMIQTP